MSLADLFLGELEQEFNITRSMLAIVPTSELAWQPHTRSMTLGRLAQHLAEIPHWSELILTGTEYDVASEAPAKAPLSTDEILIQFEAGVKATVSHLSQASDKDLEVPWSLKASGLTLMTMSRAMTFRNWVISHQIHHRGQLSVYLRLKDLALPRVYGPTADAGF